VRETFFFFSFFSFLDLTCRNRPPHSPTAPARNPPVEVLSRGGRGGVDLRAALPSSLDWRTHSPPVVGAVHNQGSVGTCYAFSALEALASQWALKTGNLTALSVQAIVDCGYVSAPPYATCGVFGGYPWLVYDYIKSRGGIMSAADVPYCSGGGPDVCYPCVPPSYNTTLCGPGPTYCNKTQTPSCDTLFDPSRFVAKVSGYVSIKNDTTAHKEALAGQPLSVCLNASMLQFYHHGVWNPHLACNRGYNTIDHCVMLVGWDDENDSYLVRNSWGEKWGLQGYFHIKQGNTCGIQEMTTYPTV
jgi:cathepsin F